MPVLLNVGITHTVAEIRSISMKTLSEFIDSSGSLLTPHLQVLVPCLLKATGELELPKLSYMSNQLGGNSEAQEMIDSARAEVAKQHHSTETLSKCIRYIDFESLEKMTPVIVELMKVAVNLGTKIACAHFVCLVRFIIISCHYLNEQTTAFQFTNESENSRNLVHKLHFNSFRFIADNDSVSKRDAIVGWEIFERMFWWSEGPQQHRT